MSVICFNREADLIDTRSGPSDAAPLLLLLYPRLISFEIHRGGGSSAMDGGTEYRGRITEDRRYRSCQSLIVPRSAFRFLNGLISRKEAFATFRLLKSRSA